MAFFGILFVWTSSKMSPFVSIFTNRNLAFHFGFSVEASSLLSSISGSLDTGLVSLLVVLVLSLTFHTRTHSSISHRWMGETLLPWWDTPMLFVVAYNSFSRCVVPLGISNMNQTCLGSQFWFLGWVLEFVTMSHKESVWDLVLKYIRSFICTIPQIA